MREKIVLQMSGFLNSQKIKISCSTVWYSTFASLFESIYVFSNSNLCILFLFYFGEQLTVPYTVLTLFGILLHQERIELDMEKVYTRKSATEFLSSYVCRKKY